MDEVVRQRLMRPSSAKKIVFKRRKERVNTEIKTVALSFLYDSNYNSF